MHLVSYKYLFMKLAFQFTWVQDIKNNFFLEHKDIKNNRMDQEEI